MLYNKNNLLWLFVVLVVSVYFVALTTEFAVHNDYRAFDNPNYSIDLFRGWQGILKHAESMHLMYIGRPINAILFNVQQSLIKNMEGFRLARYLSLSTLVFISLLTYLHLHQKLRYLKAWLVVLVFGLATIPSANLYVCWISNYIPGSFNLLLALVSWLIFDRSLTHENTNIKCLGLFFAYVILLACCFNYPATAIFFIFIPFVRIVFDKSSWIKVKYIALSALGFLVVTLVSYVVIHKFFLFGYFSHFFGDSFKSYDPISYKFSFSINQKFFELLIESIESGFSIYNTNLDNKFYLIINLLVIFISILFVSSFGQISHFVHISQKDLVEKFFIIVTFLAISLSPILLTPNGFVAYRILYVFFIFCFVLTISAYRICLDVFRLYFSFNKSVVSYALLILFGLNAFSTVTAIAKSSRAEYLYFREKINSLPRIVEHSRNGYPVNIFVTLPTRFEPFVNYSLPYDLGYTATNYSGLMEAIVFMLADAQHVNRNAYRIRVLNLAYKDNYRLPQDILSCTNCILIDTAKINKSPLF